MQVSGEDIFERNVGCGAFAAPRGKEVQQGAVNHTLLGRWDGESNSDVGRGRNTAAAVKKASFSTGMNVKS